ncbi:MAG: 23S rRNA (adenine(2503)-C(2))-methyltransferase RlmN [Dehalococcoidia bacterium]|nr:23S rRNA (adenine(2503)-C(2))-methyltransferase RlmN [Dehalococcoidia bacterium]
MPKINTTELTEKDLKATLVDWGEPEYRAKQILDWVYRKAITEFAAMSNLPPKLRERLDAEFTYQSLAPVTESRSRDANTTKLLFKLQDGKTIESVLMRYEKRRTVCVSSQVGCAFGCPLCVTGTGGFERNLTPAEIIDQVLFFSRQLRAEDKSVTNVVFMGMGEPLVNFGAVWRAIESFISPDLLGIGARHITISTAGIPPGIKKLSQKRLQVGLAVSLHAPDNALRDKLVPPNRMYPLEILIPTCQSYVEATNRRITFEYALIADINDSPQQAIQLGNLLRGINCYVNLIPVNQSANPQFKPPHRARVQAFSETLTRHHVANTVRLARGTDIEAGCGQLRARMEDISSE